MKNLILKSSPKTDDFMSLHNEPQKHIGTWIPWGTFAPRLLQGILVDTEEDMFFELFGACSVLLYGSMVCLVALFMEQLGRSMGYVHGCSENNAVRCLVTGSRMYMQRASRPMHSTAPVYS